MKRLPFLNGAVRGGVDRRSGTHSRPVRSDASSDCSGRCYFLIGLLVETYAAIRAVKFYRSGAGR